MKKILSILFLYTFTSLYLGAVDLYLHHWDKQTKMLNSENGWCLKESGSFSPRLTLEVEEEVTSTDENGETVYNYIVTPIPADQIDYSLVSPMTKIVGSDIVFDGNNNSITNTDDNHGGLIGIEVGYSPAELAADSNLKQPNSIVIKNLRLFDFDCGILIHHGVKNVTIENCQFSGSSIGILSLGQDGDVLTNMVLDLYLYDITIVGHTGLRHLSLSNLKKKIEDVYGYPQDLFMKLRPDSLNSDTEDVYTYAGIWLIGSENIRMETIKIHHIGYCDYETTSEGDGQRTYGIGMILKKCRRVNLDKIVCNDCFSELKGVGMQLENIVRMRVDNSLFSHLKSGQKAVGVEVINDDGLEYSIDEVWFDNVSCEDNEGGQVAIGMDLTDARGFLGSNLVTKFNQGEYESYGIYTKKAEALSFEDTTSSSNLATRTTNDYVTDQGIAASGFYGENVAGFQVKRCSFVAMHGLNSAYGIYLKNSTSMNINNSQFSANVSTSRRSGEEADIRSQQDISEISKFGPVVDATVTGSYGLFAQDCQRMKIDNCYAVSNYGHRSAGFCFRNCSTIGVDNSFASGQVATGLMLDSSFLLHHMLDPTVSAIQAAHMPLLFSDFTKSSVDLVTTTDLFLEKMEAIRERQVLGLEPLYNDVVTMLASTNLLQSVIARYRLWGSAFGIHAHNTVGCLFTNNTCVGQISLFDTAVGVCFSGRNSGHLVENSNLSYNNGWYLSAQALPTGSSPQYNYKYDLSAMKVFWEGLTNPWSERRSFDTGSSITTTAFSSDGTKLAIGQANNQIQIWDTASWSLQQTLTTHTGSIRSLVWNHDDSILASGSDDTTIKIWNTDTWNDDQTLSHGSAAVLGLVFSADGAQLITGTGDATDNLKIWSTSTWTAAQTLSHGAGVTSIAYNSDSSKFATASSDTSNNIQIWNATTFSVEQTLASHTDSVNTIAWSADDTLITSGSNDQTVKIWNTSDWTVAQTLTEHTDKVTQVVFKENSKKLLSSSSDNTIKSWDVANLTASEKTLTSHTASVNHVSWSNDGITIVSGAEDNLLKVHYADTWQVAQDADSVGVYNPYPYFIMQGQNLFGTDGSADDVTIRLKGAQDRTVVSPVGPISAGLILGDFIIDAYIKNNKIHFNVGNSGHGHGILLNQSYYSVIENNLIEGSVASIYGFSSGILDVSAHVLNTYMKNFLESNKVSSFSNANYMVPFNPADTNSLGFPITKMFNGNFAQPATELDNIVIEYSQNEQTYEIESLVNLPIHPDLKEKLTSNNCWQ